MKDSFLSRRRKAKLKLLVSYNGAFCRRPPSGKLRYVGGETRIISVERNTSLYNLKSKIAELICPNANFLQFCLKYHVSGSLCGDDGEEEGPVLGLLESDDDLHCMIQEYEMMELRGKLHTRVWIFVGCSNDAFSDSVDKHVVDVNRYRFCGKNNGFSKAFGDPLDCDDKNASENLFVLLNKYESKTKKLGDDSLRKILLKQQLLMKNLNGIRSSRGSREQSDTELVTENDRCQSSSKQLCCELGSSLCSGSKNLNFGGDPYRQNVLNCKRTNGIIVNNFSSGQISSVAESNSPPLNSRDGNLPMRWKGSNGSLLQKSHRVSGNQNGHYMLCPDHFVAAEKSPKVSNGLNWLVNGFNPNYEFGRVDPALLNNMNRENIMPQSGNCDRLRGMASPTCRHPSSSGVYPVESLQSNESQRRACGSSKYSHRFDLSEAKNQRASPYHFRNRSNVRQSGNHQNFRLDVKSWTGKFYPGLRSSSNISVQSPPSRSHGAMQREPLAGSYYYKIQGEQGMIEHGQMFNPLYCREENLLNSVGCRAPQHETANLGDGHVALAGNDKSLFPIDATGKSLPGAKAGDAHIDPLTSSVAEKIDTAGQEHWENSLHIPGMGGQAPLISVEEPHSEKQGEENLSSSPPNPVTGIVAKLSIDSKPLDVEGGYEALERYQRGAKDSKNYGATVVEDSLHHLSLESSGEVQLPVPCARKDISEAFLKPQSNGLDQMDEEQNNSGLIFQKSSDISSDSLSNDVSKCENDDEKSGVIQQNQKSNSSVIEKDENKKTNLGLKGNDGIPAEIAALYTHLATKELQVADFWKEAHTLGQLHHPNIVALYGVVVDGPVNCLATVTEYMVNGSLKQVLRRKDRTIDRRKRLIIAMDAAFGMEYLHEKNIVHFDLKSHNFLVNMRDPQRPVCKIGDLGLSKIKQRTFVSGGIRGTIPWMAPELLSGKSLVSEKVDVFSFGIVMWELLTGEEPYANMRPEEIIAGIIRGNMRPEIPSWCDPLWRSLMERCWSSNPDCRPSFTEIAKELRAMATSMNIKL